MKRNTLLLFLSIMLIIPINTLAKKVTCSTTLYDSIIEIDKDIININDTAKITVESNNEYELAFKNSNKEVVDVNNDGLVKALSEGSSTIGVEIKYSDESSCKTDLKVNVVSNDSTLKKLTLEEIDISPLFRSDKYEYEIKLPYKFDKINIIAEANAVNAKVTGDGRRYLNDGNNEYEIVVTASDNSTSTYKIIINREEANDEVTLDNLIVEGYVLNPRFNKNIYKYTLNVDKNVDKLNISATPTYEFANIKGNGEVILASGENIYKIVVTAENGAEGVYELVVNKNKGLSKLINMSIDNYELDSSFDSDKYIYYLTVNNDINKLNINTEVSDNDQVEIIGNDNLLDGENEIIIRVTGNDKSSSTYKIIVNKLSKEEELEIKKNNNLLKILLILFIISVIGMFILIGIFLKRNYKRKKKINNVKNKIKRNYRK